MKLKKIKIHNFRSITDMEIEAHDYMLLVGQNNAGKSTVINAIRAFYDDIKWTPQDFPKNKTADKESWVQLKFHLDDNEWHSLAEEYKKEITDQTLTVRRYFKSDDKSKFQKDQSNIFALTKERLHTALFYGAKNVGTAKLGQVLYIPALTTPAEQTKMSGPSPLRNMLNFLLKKVVSKSPAYKEIELAFEKLNAEAQKDNGFLGRISTPLNAAISSWNIKIDFSVNSVSPEDISKSLIKFIFMDSSLDDAGFDLDSYGHGFQRSVIYELIRLAPSFKDEKEITKKEFNPSFNLILFEEPEAFLHPSQQEIMAYHLRHIGAEEGQQVIITTHSPTFAGKAAEDIGKIIRIQRVDGLTTAFQPTKEKVNELFLEGGNLLTTLQAFVSNPNISKEKKTEAKKLIFNPPEEEIATQEEQFRFQLWLDTERASLFFANKVLLVEGATERGLFNYLLANDWHDLSENHICVIDVLGKFNFHRYMKLMEVYGIPHGVILDDDNNKNHQNAVNDLVEASKNDHTLATPVKLKSCLEIFLDLQKPNSHKKPVEIIKSVIGGKISKEKLQNLRTEFCRALAIS